ncbi:hypothetical protein ScPMuIL_016795 [Solemya velum]
MAPLPYEGIEKKQDEYKLPDLPYAYDGLEPYIDAATLNVHHKGHHAAYTAKMNAALGQWRGDSGAGGADLAKESILHIIQNLDKVPDKYKKPVRNNGGGFVNHNFYWACMSPNAGGKREPEGSLKTDIEKDFGSLAKFEEEFTQQALTLFGSGYVWLSRDKAGKLHISQSANQDSPLPDGFRPILVLDVWEHAYYLKHQNKRPNHITDWWQVVDWTQVDKLDKWWSKL